MSIEQIKLVATYKDMTTNEKWHGTTIVLLRKDNKTVVAGDGQVSLGNTILKSKAKKVRKIEKYDVIVGFAGSTADALTLFERLEAKLEKHTGNLPRAAVELAKDWRTDKYLRRLEALMAVADKENSYIISGTGDVLEPEDGIIGIGSGGNYALAAAKVLMEMDITAEEVARKAIKIASDICVFTNNNITIEKI
jgi:ATP-dependent HslUV protease subunit HslV